MKVIILCAGYAVRLHPLTLNTPKPLLPVAGKPMLEYLLEKVAEIEPLDSVWIVSNGKFAGHFEDWAKSAPILKEKIHVVNDGTLTNETRLGAIGDLDLVLRQGKINEDVLLLAGDNLFSFHLNEFVQIAMKHKPFSSLGIYDVGDLNLAKNYGLVQVRASGKITAFLEKPPEPKTTLASTGVYFFPQEALELVRVYLSEKNNPDAPGYFVKWLVERSSVYGVPLAGFWYDIGDRASYDEVNRLLQNGPPPACR
ncbi:MAG: nucleotidyltransferase family protein [Candidatus Omnitrophica bacterium]|nr:nucleotidyltransferase family protein [Candidatus Omnitrophota bacterium]